MHELPVRKPNRLQDYDYSQNGEYFVTVCAKDRAEIFGAVVGAATCRPQPHIELSEYGKMVEIAISNIITIYPRVTTCAHVVMPNHIHMIVGAATCRPRPPAAQPQPHIELSEYGKMVEIAISNIITIYPRVNVCAYVVMPNHIHMIIVLGEHGRQIAAPTVSTIVGNMKKHVSLNIGFSPWQKSFHDHIIRDEKEYRRIAEYIENNPSHWEEDCFYTDKL
jgi:REP element-mobilizing transposase RayT